MGWRETESERRERVSGEGHHHNNEGSACSCCCVWACGVRVRARVWWCVRACVWRVFSSAPLLLLSAPSPSSVSPPQQPLCKKKRGCTVRALPQWSPT